MKKYLFFIAIAAGISFTSCGAGNKAEIDKMQAKIDSLQSLNGNLTESDNSNLAAINEIFNNLEDVKRNQGIISENNTGDVEGDKKAMIQESINTIAALMDENKSKLESLQKKLKSSGKKNTQLQALVDNLNQQIIEKDKEIESLKGQLAELNITVQKMSGKIDSLSTENENNKTTIENQTNEMNTVYYCLGTFKELVDNKVIDKGGAFAAKSGSKVSGDTNMDYYTKTDKRNLSSITVGGAKKVTFKTSHPSTSYTLVKDGNKITKVEITDKDAFWKNSKFCVIMTE